MITVEKLLKLPTLKNLRLVAGKSGLQRKVGHVTVVEVPDVVQWLKGYDFLLTSLYAVKDSLPSQCDLVRALAHSSSACIAIKTGQYVSEISDELKGIADEYGFPLLEIPYDLTYIDIIMSAMTYIFEERNPRVVLEKYIKDIIFEAYTDKELMLERGKLLDCHAGKIYMAMTLQFPAHYEPSDQEAGTLWRAGIAVAQFASAQNGLLHCIAVNTSNNSSIFLDSEDERTLRRLIPLIEQEAAAQLEYAFPGHRLHIGYGLAMSGLDGIKNTYFDSIRAIRSGQIFYPDRRSYHFGDIEFEIVMEEVIGNRAAGRFQNVLDKLGGDDILHTLMTYYECGTSLDKTASVLFTHKNTVKYRLVKVRDLTGLDVRVFGDSVKLYMAITALKIQNAQPTKG